MYSVAQLIAELILLVLSGGNRTTAANIRQLITDILNSMPNWVDGGNNFKSAVGYDPSSTITLSPTSFITSANIMSSGIIHTTTGTGSAYLISIPNITSYANMRNVILQLHTANLTGATITFNSLAPLTMRIGGNTTLLDNYCNAGLIISGVINTPYFDIISFTNNLEIAF